MRTYILLLFTLFTLATAAQSFNDLCRKGIESVRKNAPGARLEDQTEEGWAQLPNPKFELYQDKAGQFRFRLRARNGKIIAVSENYSGKAVCLKGIESVKINSGEAGIMEE